MAKLKKYKCWFPEYSSEEVAATVEAESIRSAADAFARTSYDDEAFEEETFVVKPIDGKLKGKIFEFTVEAEVEVHFDVGLGTEITD